MRGALILVAALAVAGCNMAADAEKGDAHHAGAGPMTERSFNLAGFNSVSLAGPHDVIVTVGPAFSVRAEGPSDVLDRLDLKVENGNLEIGMKRGRWSLRHGDRQKTVIHVTMPAIQAAAIGGSGDMRIDKAQGPRFSASIGGSGDIEIASLRVGEASFSVAGSGGIRASGTAQKSDVSIAGSGDVDVQGLETRTASVSIVGSGGVRAHAIETASVSIMGSGDVDISGSAKCSVSKMGSGDVRCGG
jgi:hypothetical protein